MSAASRLTRLLALPPWLLAHPGVTVRECADHFEITPAQLEADLYLLVVSGDGALGAGELVDIQFWADDDSDDDADPAARLDATIRVVRAQAFDRPLRLNASEAMALLVGLRMLAQLPGLADPDAIASAVAKLEGATSSAADAIADDQVAVDVAVDPDVRASVDRALADGDELVLRYAAATSGAVTERQVVPTGVIAVDGIAYLDAFCRFAGARRTFRLDRVLEATVTPAVEPPDADLPEWDGTPPGLAPAASSVVLDLDPASRWVAEAHRATLVEERPDGGVRVRLPLHDRQWAVGLVLSMGGGATVVEPADLAEAVSDTARSALAAYAGPLR